MKTQISERSNAALSVRQLFLDTFARAGFRSSEPLSLLQPTIATSFLFSVGFVDVLDAIEGGSPELDSAATVQRCFRHFDLNRVSDRTHLSLFEMAGALRCTNWTPSTLVEPLGHFLFDVCALPEARLHVTYFGGDRIAGQTLPEDRETLEAYLASGVPRERIHPGGAATNIWFEGANSGTDRSGVCGPHSEVFLNLDSETAATASATPLTHPDRFLEISNLVTITHRAHRSMHDGMEPLTQPLVELAVGVERLEMAMTGAMSVHEVPKLRAIAGVILEARGHEDLTPEDVVALRTAADHARAIVHLISDGGRPGPKGRGHVVRGVIKRFLTALHVLGMDGAEAFPPIARCVSNVDANINPSLPSNREELVGVFNVEVARMRKAAVRRKG